MATRDFDLNLIADDLGKSLVDLAPEIKKEINRGVRDVAFGAQAKIISELQNRNTPPIKRSTYLEALKLKKIPDGYLIFLDGSWATRLEDGYASYSIKELLLNSRKMVSAGKNAGKPWVRTNKQGKKFAAVPFQQHPFSKEPGVADLNALIRKISVKNAIGRRQRITQLFKDVEGNKIVGKAAVVGEADLERIGVDNPNLIGLTKYQEFTKGGASKSFYATFRTVSEISTGWIHPGAQGYGLFKQAEKYVEAELARIVNTLVD